MRLTDTHLLLLSAAAQHPEQLLPKPDRVHGRAAQALAAKLTRAGLVTEVVVRFDQPHWRLQAETALGLRITREGLLALGLDEEAQAAAPAPAPALTQRPAGAPRAGSKQAAVLALLRREQGATLADLVQATGWLDHTTRAALTGLRQRGYALERRKGEDGRAVYRLNEPSALTLG